MQDVNKRAPAQLRPYLWLILAAGVLAAVSYGAGPLILARLDSLEETPTAPELAALALFALCGFASFYGTRGTPLPAFVVAIVLGVAGHPLFAPIVASPLALGSLVTASAALILFSGGLEMAKPPWNSCACSPRSRSWPFPASSSPASPSRAWPRASARPWASASRRRW